MSVYEFKLRGLEERRWCAPTHQGSGDGDGDWVLRNVDNHIKLGRRHKASYLLFINLF